LELIVRRESERAHSLNIESVLLLVVLFISIAESLYGSFMGRVFARRCPPISVSVVVDSFALPPVLKYLLGPERRPELD
jgi:hypothetical protein